MSTQLIPSEQAANEAHTVSEWNVDPAHSSVEFAVRHMMVSTVKGVFKGLSGSIRLAEDRLEDSQVSAEIDAATIDTGVSDRDTHLRSADFFDAATFPKLVFRSTGIETDGGDAGRMHGELTMHGVTKPVLLDVSYLGEIRDPWGNRRRGFAAESTLSRKDFGMTWNKVLDAGGVVVGDKVKVTLNIEAVEKGKA